MGEPATAIQPAAVVVRELGDAACRALLGSRDVGRLGFVAHGYPLVLPVSYAFADGRIWISTGGGSRLDHAPLSPVCFEVDDLDAASRTGWSVLARGVAHWASADDGVPPATAPPWVPGPLPARLVVKVRRLSGRRFERTAPS